MSELRFNRRTVYIEKPPFPNNILLELTNACNHHCVFCNNREQNRKIQSINKNLALRLIDEGYINGAREIGFYILGEPFLVKALEDYVYKASHIGQNKEYEYIYLTTNGSLATADRVEKLIRNGLSSIKFSINAGTKESYKMVHGKDEFDVVIKNISEVYDVKEKLKKEGYIFSMFASFVENNINKDEFELLQEKVGNYFDKMYKYPLENLAGYNSKLKIGQCVLSGMMPCSQLFNRFHINSAGYMIACCYDYDGMMSIADLNDMSMMEAWNCDLAIDLRKQHLLGHIGKNLCRKCLHVDCEDDVKALNEELYEKGLQI